ncbi:hypothetical protein [Parasitella parasitica]|uniref:Uncharacterized protein n=1 Tax=Parasitella parasitica TaxID=35722 RepID=A0A0B7N2E0_9FUNG|nr:hypothetical protein [Parasitella parasitica]CEP09553.1 hypothetical protein [Parasitella parasitica]
MDMVSVNTGPHTSHFTPKSATRILLNKESIAVAKSFYGNRIKHDSPYLYALKQVRSKFTHISTYSRARFSACDLHLQPTTIWTLADAETTSSTMTQEKIISSLFQKIAISVAKHHLNAKIMNKDIQDLIDQCSDTRGSAILRKIQLLPNKTIIGNVDLDASLKDLAAMLSHGISRRNEKKKKDMIRQLHGITQ